jgi:hypothetical protein
MDKPNRMPVVPIVPQAHAFVMRSDRELEGEHQSAVISPQRIADARCKPRFKLEVDITITSRTSGELKGRTVDISESGIAAVLTVEAPLGEVVELNFTLSFGPVTIHAMVRQRNAFRYGFEFIDPDFVPEFIRRTCRDLAVDQSLILSDAR